ncbi:MAG: hypothetical protein H8D23_24720 [Candidatus Brocadiales bacterium]|nr:hypothetical protein [Candidatus Brocadiales bacterium]
MRKYLLLQILVISLILFQTHTIRTVSNDYENHDPLRIYSDAVYGFKFQYPSDWKVVSEKVPTGTGEIRVGLISPIGATCAATIVKLEGSAKREDFLNPHK